MTLLVLGGLFALSVGLVAVRGGVSGVREGLTVAVRLLRQVALLIVLGMALAALAGHVLPADLITRWMGNESGIVGVLIGTALGALVPGGPYVILPLAGSVLASGAGIGSVAAFITAWSLIPVSRTLMFELPFMGGAFTASRLLVNTPVPVIVGLLTPPVYTLLT